MTGPQQQLTLAGMPRRLFTCTPTRLATWLDCPRRYRMTYLDRPQPPKGPPWAHNSVGASIHTALASWWRRPLPERTPATAGALLSQGWLTDGFADDAQAGRYARWARAMVERYTAGLDPAAEPAGVERTVSTRTEVIAVSGRIDRLDDRPPRPGEAGGLVVVDYKTGRHAPDAGDARSSLALALYALAAGRTLRRPCQRVELHHLPTATTASWEHTAKALERHLQRAEDIAAECAAAQESRQAGQAGQPGPEGPAGAEVFPPAPGPGCGWCDFRAQCPEGSAAGQARRPFDGLWPEV